MFRPWIMALALAVALVVTGCRTTPSHPPMYYRVVPPSGQAHEILESPKGAARSEENTTAKGRLKGEAARDQIRNECMRWMGAPYRPGGSNPKGVDCSGFTTQVYLRALGLKLPRTAAQQYWVGLTVHTNELATGDLLFFKTSNEAPITHVGIYLEDGKFAHSSTHKGVMLNKLADKYYWQAYRGAKRIIN